MERENGYSPEAPEVDEDGFTEQERELMEQWLPKYTETDAIKEKRDCEGEVIELVQLLDKFELEHSLGELHAVTELTVEDAPQHPIRHSAHEALTPINALLSRLKEETSIAEERYTELNDRYKDFSRAVGWINKGKVIHE